MKTIKRNKNISNKIISVLENAGNRGVTIDDITNLIYNSNGKKEQMKTIKNICMIRIRKQLNIVYDRKNRTYFLG